MNADSSSAWEQAAASSDRGRRPRIASFSRQPAAANGSRAGLSADGSPPVCFRTLQPDPREGGGPLASEKALTLLTAPKFIAETARSAQVGSGTFNSPICRSTTAARSKRRRRP